MKLRLFAAGLAGLVVVSLVGFGGRKLWCARIVDGESIGGFPAETFGEYQDAVEAESRGCTQVVLVRVDGEIVQEPDPETLIETVTGMMLSGPITVYERGPGGPAAAPALSLPTILDVSSFLGNTFLQGELVADGSCVYFQEEAGERYLPVFKSGAASATTAGLVIDRYEFLFSDREVVQFGGGETSEDQLEFETMPHDSCDTTLMWVVTGL